MRKHLIAGIAVAALFGTALSPVTFDVAHAQIVIIPGGGGAAAGGGSGSGSSGGSGGGKGGVSGGALAGACIGGAALSTILTAGGKEDRELTPREAAEAMARGCPIFLPLVLLYPPDNAETYRIARDAARFRQTPRGKMLLDLCRRGPAADGCDPGFGPFMERYVKAYRSGQKPIVQLGTKPTDAAKPSKVRASKARVASPGQSVGARFIPPSQWAPNWQTAPEEQKYFLKWYQTR